MDFKVCGTKKGVTAIQMDIKIAGLSREVLSQALEQAREGRVFILDKMLGTLAHARPDLSKWAPRITQIKVKPDQIRLIIGPGGKTIKGIIDQTGVAIDVEDDGTVNVASSDSDAVKKALDIIKGLTTEPEVGAVYKGTVTRIADFGAFIEILPGTDGLLHVSEMAHHRVDKVTDVMKEGDAVEVKVHGVFAHEARLDDPRVACFSPRLERAGQALGRKDEPGVRITGEKESPLDSLGRVSSRQRCDLRIRQAGEIDDVRLGRGAHPPDVERRDAAHVGQPRGGTRDEGGAIRTDASP
jgi:hypothetical protein